MSVKYAIRRNYATTLALVRDTSRIYITTVAAQVLEELLGKDAALVELAAKHSSYGSWSQSWHKDAVTCTANAETWSYRSVTKWVET